MIRETDVSAAAASTASGPAARVESFDPVTVRPWHFHNRVGSGMDDLSIDALAESIGRIGQQQPGLARRLPARRHPRGRGGLRRAPVGGLPAGGRDVACAAPRRLALRCRMRGADAQRERLYGGGLAAGERPAVAGHAG